MTCSTLDRTSVFQFKDPISAITHGIGFVFAIFATPVIMVKAAQTTNDMLLIRSIATFMSSMILLYGASFTYHALNLSGQGNLILKRIDHISIFYLIAGSYTPICLGPLHDCGGTVLFLVIYGIALAGTIFKLCWVTCPKWISSVLYIAMGWSVLGVFPVLLGALSTSAFAWLLAGGLFYTIGGVIYALKPALFPREKVTGFGNHELFHLFVMAGTLCHFVMFYFCFL